MNLLISLTRGKMYCDEVRNKTTICYFLFLLINLVFCGVNFEHVEDESLKPKRVEIQCIEIIRTH